MSSRRELLMKYGNVPKQPSNKPKKKKPKVKIIDESGGFGKSDNDEERPQIIDESQVFETKFTKQRWETVQESVGNSRKSPSLSPGANYNRKSPSLSPKRSPQQDPRGLNDLAPRQSPESRVRKSPSPVRRRARRSPTLSPSPELKRNRSKSPAPERRRHRSRTPTPERRRNRSKSPSPERRRKRSRSPSPVLRRARRSVSKSPEPVSNIQHETIYRDKTGRKVDLKAQEQAILEQKRHAEVQTKFQDKFTSGLVQSESRMKSLLELEDAKNRGVAVYADDKDLDRQLRERVHWDDPMAKPKKRKKDKGKKSKSKSRPEYEGAAPPNRFNIRPGYRWDGIDRSNGFEVKVFRAQDRDAELRDEYHKWATEDM